MKIQLFQLGFKCKELIKLNQKLYFQNALKLIIFFLKKSRALSLIKFKRKILILLRKVFLP